LKDWLAYIESLHPEEIELGLDRVRAVFQKLDVSFDDVPVITVAGTNGKGSTVVLLESVYLAAGYRVCSYTSPHLLRYNERVRANGAEVSDEQLCAGFAAVESARGETSLTYFEFGTLAALWIFANADADMLILETGLGGRLDAVNVMDCDIAVITSIDIDHREWLGDDREQIAIEKAGIFRAGCVAVCGDADPPASIGQQARALGVRLLQIGDDFTLSADEGEWCWQGPSSQMQSLPFPGLAGPHQLTNAAAALAVVHLLQHRLPVTRQAIDSGLVSSHLPGRLQSIEGSPSLLLDVAHNPQATTTLAGYLRDHPIAGQRRAVVGMLADKDISGNLQSLLPFIDAWYLAGLPGPRAASAHALAAVLDTIGNRKPSQRFASPVQAFRAALQDASAEDQLVVFGSFLTVSAIMAEL
jgi:dihydrofolate synthase/folylpolyglutamate synthase